MKYVISKDYDKLTHDVFWYCHMDGFAYIPVFGSIGTKAHAQSVCNKMNASIGKGNNER